MLEAINRKQAYGKNEALKGLDPKVNSDDICCLLGANRAGKTATINLLPPPGMQPVCCAKLPRSCYVPQDRIINRQSIDNK
jgi:ABC-type Mn2+/Zn2+ transport system ATPase subunit